MVCFKCGQPLAPNELFCPRCGAQQPLQPYPSKVVPPRSVNIFEIIAAIVMALGTLLPCYSVSFFGQSANVAYIEGDGIIILIAAILIALVTFIKKEKFAVIPAIISVILLAIFSANLSDATMGIGETGIGMYLMWIGSIAALVCPFIPRNK